MSVPSGIPGVAFLWRELGSSQLGAAARPSPLPLLVFLSVQ